MICPVCMAYMIQHPELREWKKCPVCAYSEKVTEELKNCIDCKLRGECCKDVKGTTERKK